MIYEIINQLNFLASQAAKPSGENLRNLRLSAISRFKKLF